MSTQVEDEVTPLEATSAVAALEQAERRRQAYLQALGLTLWLPLRPLPGAATSPRWYWQTDPPASAAAPTASPAVARRVSAEAEDSLQAARQMLSTAENGKPEEARRSAAQARATAEAGALSDAGSASAGDTTAATAPVVRQEDGLEATADSASSPASGAGAWSQPSPHEPATDKQAVPRLHLSLYSFDDCLVINELPLQALSAEDAAQRRLLEAILAAVSLGQGQPQREIFTWPLLPVDSGHDQSLPVARLSLQETLGAEQWPPEGRVLVLGESAARCVSGEGSLAAHENSPVGACVFGPSLQELLRLPERKAELWHSLQVWRLVSADSRH